ncbi:hypothetical protein P3W45_001577 [Vairimorpha bombi]
MKISDKRNKNKMKNEHKARINKIESKVYNNEHGPYKVVSFVNLGGDMNKIQEEFLDNLSRNLYYYKNKATNFLFQDTQSLTDYEMSYVTRTSDIVVFVVNSKDIDPKKILLVKRHLPSCLFVILDKSLLKTCKKFVSEHIPDQKIIEIGSLLDYLCLIKSRSTNICSRPYMVPITVNYDGEFVLAKGFMKKGLISDKVVINGKYDGQIIEIKNEKIRPKDLNLSDNENKYPSMITKYSEYRGIRNIATCEFSTDKYPEYYKDLLFFQDYKHVQKYITERKSIISDNQIIEIKIKTSQPITDNMFVMFNYYDFEEYNTIQNFGYSISSGLKTGEKLYVDYGHKIIEVSPTITKNANQNSYKREEGLENGVISFIGPMTFNINKILIFEENPLREISTETYKCVGVNLGIKERKLYDEVVLEGLPIKIHKRSCIIKRMFYSKEEVLYFKDVKLHTKNGRSKLISLILYPLMIKY